MALGVLFVALAPVEVVAAIDDPDFGSSRWSASQSVLTRYVSRSAQPLLLSEVLIAFTISLSVGATRNWTQALDDEAAY